MKSVHSKFNRMHYTTLWYTNVHFDFGQRYDTDNCAITV